MSAMAASTAKPTGVSSNVVRAAILVVSSAICASLTSVNASYIVEHCGYFSPLEVLCAAGTTGCVVSTLWWAVEALTSDAGRPSRSLLGDAEQRWWFLARGVAGCMANASAWVALSRLTVAVANTIMFTSPLFTLLGGHLVFGHPWRPHDTAISGLCLVGVLLVARPAGATWLPDWGIAGDEGAIGCAYAPSAGIAGEAGAAHTRANDSVGILAAVCFSLSTAAASLIINTQLRGQSTVTVTWWVFACICAVSWPALALARGTLLAHGSTQPTWLLATLGLSNVCFQYLRAAGFQLSATAAVSTMLYSEIVFAFVLGVAVLRQHVYYAAMLGAALIIGGALLQVHVQMQHRADAEGRVGVARARHGARLRDPVPDEAETRASDYVLVEDPS